MSVTLNGVTASIMNQSDSNLVLIAGLGTPGIGNIVLTTDSQSRGVSLDAWTYVPVPNISSVSPTSGQIGTLITIRGFGLLDQDGGSTIQSVFVAGVPGIPLLSNSTVVVFHAPSTVR